MDSRSKYVKLNEIVNGIIDDYVQRLSKFQKHVYFPSYNTPPKVDKDISDITNKALQNLSKYIVAEMVLNENMVFIEYIEKWINHGKKNDSFGTYIYVPSMISRVFNNINRHVSKLYMNIYKMHRTLADNKSECVYLPIIKSEIKDIQNNINVLKSYSVVMKYMNDVMNESNVFDVYESEASGLCKSVEDMLTNMKGVL